MGAIVDSFAGGGGASLGIERGLGRPVTVAINHDPEAVAMHMANHPQTEHHCQNVWQVDPADVVRKHGPIDLAWFSPDCKHHSKAKGGKPVERNIRDLAWVVVLWAERAEPDVIMLENVEEFRDWGPLTDNNMPCPKRKGETFELWVRRLRAAGYTRIEHRNLRACEHGVPTSRRRMFLIARHDGKPIIWPEPTHGPGLLPYRTAAECIDWSKPCPSIFLTRDQARQLRLDTGIRCNRPLVDATMRRIAKGMAKYVLEANEPFIVPVTHRGDDRVHGIAEPLRTITCAHRGEHALVSPYLVPHYGEREGQEPRCRSIEEPMPTVVPTGNGGRLVAAFMAQHNGGMVGHDCREPLSTITQRATQQQVVAAYMSHQYSSNTCGGEGDPRKPMTTVTAGGGHQSLVAALMTKYYGEGGQWQDCRDPMHTATVKGRMGLVTVNIAGATWVVDDIGMRMLTPRELFRAQGFPDSYRIDPEFNGKPLTITAQTSCCGNSVPPDLPELLTRANCADSASMVAA